MTTDRFRGLTEDADFPLTIRMRSGKKYTLRTRHTFFISDDYPDVVILTRPQKAVVFVAIEAIDEIQTEHAAIAG